MFSFNGILVNWEFCCALGFLVVGFAIGRFVLDAYQKANWQLQITLALGFFGLLIGLTDFASPGSSGAYALGAGVALIIASMNKTKDGEEEKKEEDYSKQALNWEPVLFSVRKRISSLTNTIFAVEYRQSEGSYFFTIP